MAWGALSGLGSGLQQVGGLLMDNNKQKLAQQLEIDKEKRAEARADKVYERDQSSFDHSALEQTPEGVWMQVDYAKSGRKLDSRLAPPNIVNDMNMKTQKDKVSLENDILTGKKIQSELDYAPVKQELDRRDTESNIQYRDRMGLAASTRADNATGNSSTASDAARTLVNSYSDLVKSYTGGDSPTMTAAEVEDLALQVVKAAALQKVDAATLFRNELQRRADSKASPDKLNFR